MDVSVLTSARWGRRAVSRVALVCVTAAEEAPRKTAVEEAEDERRLRERERERVAELLEPLSPRRRLRRRLRRRRDRLGRSPFGRT